VRVDVFDFTLPADHIALRPARPRDSARLLVVDGEVVEDWVVRDLPRILKPGDVLVFNDTKVIPAALVGRRIGRAPGEPRIEVLLHQRLDPACWRAFAKPGRKLQPGDRLRFGEEGEVCLLGDVLATVESKGAGGEITLAFDFAGTVLDEALALIGAMPLPPYISGRRRADESDRTDYQTIFAAHEGAVAAPTAGLHFTSTLFDALSERGVESETVTLHVGAGTFLPIKTKDTVDHRMHAEWGEVAPGVADRLEDARRQGRRIVAVGTTTLRLLETAAASGAIKPYSGQTDIFITPGHAFRAVDLLFTNFHLPRSTLFMLVCAFAGTDRMKKAYAQAIERGYRFYSYGDASLLSRAA
jgi:S-adenosylmethionine:tRNA ribosyltransferase-isomerase